MSATNHPGYEVGVLRRIQSRGCLLEVSRSWVLPWGADIVGFTGVDGDESACLLQRSDHLERVDDEDAVELSEQELMFDKVLLCWGGRCMGQQSHSPGLRRSSLIVMVIGRDMTGFFVRILKPDIERKEWAASPAFCTSAHSDTICMIKNVDSGIRCLGMFQVSHE